jgi:hypothetical protein
MRVDSARDIAWIYPREYLFSVPVCAARPYLSARWDTLGTRATEGRAQSEGSRR